MGMNFDIKKVANGYILNAAGELRVYPEGKVSELVEDIRQIVLDKIKDEKEKFKFAAGYAVAPAPGNGWITTVAETTGYGTRQMQDTLARNEESRLLANR